MAYDSSAYQAPSRTYYPQTRQQVPVQHGYRGQSEPQYSEPSSGWGQGHPQQSYANGYVEEPAQYWEESGHSNAYAGRPERSHQQPRPQQQQQSHPQYQQRPHQPQPQPQPQYPPPGNSYAQEQERYDPRYQQRQGRAAPPSHAQIPAARAQFPQEQQSAVAPQPHVRNPGPRPQPSQERRDYQSPPATVPPNHHQRPPLQQPQQWTNGYSHSDPSRPQMFEQQSADLVSPQYRQGSVPLPKQSRSQPQGPPEPKKMTMEEWKAKEKSKLHNDALSPETLPQDNAFPVFPVKKKERPDRGDGASVMSYRSSEEQTRSLTPSSVRPQQVPTERRPGMASRENSHDHDPPRANGHLQPQGRPSIDHKPFSFEAIPQRRDQAQESVHPKQQPQYEKRPSEPRQPASGLVRSPEREYHEAQWLTQVSQAPQGPPQQQRKPPLRSATASDLPPPLQPINTRQAQRPVHSDHQALSPISIPQRPSTTEGSRPHQAMPQDRSPLSQFSYSQTPQDYDPDPATRRPAPQQLEAPHTRHDTVESVVHGYADVAGRRVPQRERTRDEEIEEEMPDFDSAAPSQTSLLQKRKKTSDKLPPGSAIALNALPAQVRPSREATTSSQSVPIQSTRFYGGPPQNGSYDQLAAQKQRYAGPTDAYDLGAQDVATQQYAESPSYNDRRPPYQQHGAPIQPPKTSQPAYAHEPPPQRSMVDERQMPYRGPPQAQRFPPNEQLVQGQYPPQPRPEMDRTFTGQTVNSMQSGQPAYLDPGQQRMASAPPLRQGFGVPPGLASNGATLTQQYASPEERQRQGNPDALPHHPVPVRPGLMEHGGQQPSKPPPIRNHEVAPSQQRTASLEVPSKPVTNQELDQLRASVTANPNNNKQAFLLAKKLVEASTVLASEGGRADPRITAKNREKYILEAHKRIRKLVSSGYPEAQFYLADCYGQGSLGLEVDTKEAFNLYQAAAKAGHPQAAYRTAVCCEMGAEEGGGTRRDYPKALQWYTRAAALGDTAAMYKIGVSKLKGLLGSPRNIGDAVTWLKRAAERADKENPHALHELATLYEPANANPELRNKLIADEAYARELFQSAAALGYKFSQFRLGQAYEYGALGLPIDNRASIAWYSKAAAQGEHQAELALSGWYLTGAEGILEHSDTEAYLWARKAASSEPPLAKAMFAMGYFSEMGIGCPQSIEDARRWYGRAASFKFPKALERLEELKKSGKNNRPAPVNGKLSRKDQKRDEAECAVM